MLDIVCRSHQRIKIHKYLSYNGLDGNRSVIDRYMGTALDISMNGIRLATDRMIDAKYILLMFFDYKSNYIAANGKVVYSKKDETGKFRTGIHLQGTNGENIQFVKKLIKSYRYQKRVPIFVS